MRVFVSSLIGGFEAERAAARRSITTLRHEPVMAEDFEAQANSPQVACLRGLRAADLVVLILGERYGAVQESSGISATHEEFLEARDTKPMLVFVKEGGSRESAQTDFISEVQEWEGGYFRAPFETSEELGVAVTRALHDHELATAVAPLDLDALKAAAAALLPVEDTRFITSREPRINLGFAGGPRQQILRPSRIEDPELTETLQQAALFGALRIFELSSGIQTTLEMDGLKISQGNGASVFINEQAELGISLPLSRGDSRSFSSVDASVLVSENVSATLSSAIAYASWLIDQVDPTQRLSHVSLAVNITGARNHVWRTQAEHAANPNSIEYNFHQSDARQEVVIDKPRPSLRLDRMGIVEDIVVPLRRQWRQTR